MTDTSSRAVVPAAIEALQLPAHLDGRSGSNRGNDERAQIAADNDIDAIKAWLARFIDTRTTFDSYRKEAERLLLWATVELGKPLSSLVHEDWLRYRKFLQDPQPAERWISPAGRKFPRAHPQWRPFAGPLSPSSQRQAAIILNALFSCWYRRATWPATRWPCRANARAARCRVSRAIWTTKCGPK